jgi:hypothetical protein
MHIPTYLYDSKCEMFTPMKYYDIESNEWSLV